MPLVDAKLDLWGEPGGHPGYLLLRLAWPVPESLSRRWRVACCPDRRAQAARLKLPEDQARCLAAGWLLSRIAPGKEYKDALGRPGLADQPGQHISLTHSGDWVGCAAHDQAVGIDVERVEAADEGMARTFMSGPELARYSRLAEPERTEFFFRIWTAKEAWLKAKGTGFSGRPESTTVRWDGAEPVGLAAPAAGGPWRLRQQPLPGGYWLALCWAAER